MGLLDLPAPLFSGLDEWFAGLLTPTGALTVWAALGAFLCMECYRLLSPQRRIVELKVKLEQTRQHLATFDGEFEEAWPQIRAMLSLAFRRVALVFPATIVASLPLLLVIVWLDTQYGGTFPPAETPVRVAVDGGAYAGRWIDDGTPRAQITDQTGAPIAEIPVKKPVPVIEKRHWWNALIGNPAGYLADDLPFNRVTIDLPRREILPVGPTWLRGWEIPFFVALTLFALAFKMIRGIA